MGILTEYYQVKEDIFQLQDTLEKIKLDNKKINVSQGLGGKEEEA